MPTPSEIEAVTKVINGRCGCDYAECVEMIPPPEGNCTCAMIAVIALEAAERARDKRTEDSIDDRT